MTAMHEQYDEVEREIMVAYRLMLDYRELEEPDMAGFHEHRMNNALVQWGDLHKFLGNQALDLTPTAEQSTI